MSLDWRKCWVSALSWFWNPVLLRAQGLLRSEWVTQSLSTKVTQESFRINPGWPLGSFVSVFWELGVLAFNRTPAPGKMKARLRWADGVGSLLGAALSQVRSACSHVRVLQCWELFKNLCIPYCFPDFCQWHLNCNLCFQASLGW